MQTQIHYNDKTVCSTTLHGSVEVDLSWTSQLATASRILLSFALFMLLARLRVFRTTNGFILAAFATSESEIFLAL